MKIVAVGALGAKEQQFPRWILNYKENKQTTNKGHTKCFPKGISVLPAS